MIVLLILVSSSSLSPTWEGILQGLIVIVGLGLVTFWLDGHPSAFIAPSSCKSDYTVYEYFPADEMEAEEAEIFQSSLNSGEVSSRQLVIDQRRIRDLVKEREEKWSLN